MLRVFLFGLSLFSYNVMSHGQYPQTVNEYVVDTHFEFKFTLINGFKKRTCYEIYINDQVDGTLSRCLMPGESRDLNVWLMSKPNVQTFNEVCSVSLTSKGFNTRMCSKVTTYFPAEELGIVGELEK
ncbi:hypothetical protein VFDL14_07235 [Vibrio fortis]|uniref:Uncharacterized protein n=1 Tax=Vibrio fortis TaxID=212667 RepID=A0A066V2A2_9VIBR|nr:hypothetical protein VFDL14_07235 [Vibrio fortis]